MFKITELGLKQSEISLHKEKKENILEMLEELTEWFEYSSEDIAKKLNIDCEYLDKIMNDDAIIHKNLGLKIYNFWREAYSKKII